jgi:hypothetical protein
LGLFLGIVGGFFVEFLLHQDVVKSFDDIVLEGGDFESVADVFELAVLILASIGLDFAAL